MFLNLSTKSCLRDKRNCISGENFKNSTKLGKFQERFSFVFQLQFLCGISFWCRCGSWWSELKSSLQQFLSWTPTFQWTFFKLVFFGQNFSLQNLSQEYVSKSFCESKWGKMRRNEKSWKIHVYFLFKISDPQPEEDIEEGKEQQSDTQLTNKFVGILGCHEIFLMRSAKHAQMQKQLPRLNEALFVCRSILWGRIHQEWWKSLWNSHHLREAESMSSLSGWCGVCFEPCQSHCCDWGQSQ